MKTKLKTCPDCGGRFPGNDAAVTCCKPKVSKRINRVVGKTKDFLVKNHQSPAEVRAKHDCVHLGQSVGSANCGCQGKFAVHWCDLLQGHTTPQTPGKTWLTIATDAGKIDRVGRLKPCLHCPHRNRLIAYDQPVEDPASDRLLITVATGDFGRVLELTRPSLMAYAQRIGADYREITEAQYDRWQHEKLRVHAYAQQYDRTLFVDADIVIRDSAPNLFDLVPEDAVGIHDDWPFGFDLRWLPGSRRYVADALRCEIFDTPQCLNTGVVVSSRQHADIWQQPEFLLPRDDHCGEQIWVENQIVKNGFQIHKLPWEFNWQWWFKPFRDRIGDAHFVHFSGYKGDKLPLVQEFLRTMPTLL